MKKNELDAGQNCSHKQCMCISGQSGLKDPCAEAASEVINDTTLSAGNESQIVPSVRSEGTLTQHYFASPVAGKSTVLSHPNQYQ